MISIASFLTFIRLWLAGQFNKARKRNELSLFPSPIATRCCCRCTSKSEVAEWMQSLCSKPEIRTKITSVFLMFLFAPLLQSRQGKTFEHESYFPGMNPLVTTLPKDCKNLWVTVIWHFYTYTHSCLSLESGSEHQFPAWFSPSRYYTLHSCQLWASFVTTTLVPRAVIIL